MLIISLALAIIGLAALVFAVVTSNAVVAWVCIGTSSLGVLLLIVDALRERRQNRSASAAASAQGSAGAGSEAEVEAADEAGDAEDGPEAELSADTDAAENAAIAGIDDSTRDDVADEPVDEADDADEADEADADRSAD